MVNNCIRIDMNGNGFSGRETVPISEKIKRSQYFEDFQEKETVLPFEHKPFNLMRWLVIGLITYILLRK